MPPKGVEGLTGVAKWLKDKPKIDAMLDAMRREQNGVCPKCNRAYDSPKSGIKSKS